MTKFLVMITEPEHFERWEAADDAEQERHFACYRAFSAAVKERGRVVGGEALTHPATARTLRPGADGGSEVTEGPYAETAEQVGGFWIIDVADLDSAVELARLLPADYTTEVRECLDVEVS